MQKTSYPMFKEQLFEQLNKQNEKDIKSTLNTPDNLYLDLSLCKDFTLGYVYYQLSTKTAPQYREERYNEILKGIPEWQKRTFDDFEAIYPGYGITNEEIQQALNDVTLANHIFQFAPNTEFYTTLKTELAINNNHSQVSEKFKKHYLQNGKYIREYDPITLYVNTYPLQLSDQVRDIVGRYFADHFGVNVVVLTTQPNTLDRTPTWLDKVQTMYLYSIEDWTDSPHIRNELDQSVQFFVKGGDKSLDRIADNKALFFKKKLYSRRMFSLRAQARMKQTNQSFDYQFNLVTSNLGILTEFEWIPNSFIALIPTPDDAVVEPDYDDSLDKLMALAKKD